jgi:hypothetical protein
MDLRSKFDLDQQSLDRMAVLIHGAYGAGKTHLQGDFLKWCQAKKQGDVLFLNIKGEDGSLTLRGMGLGNVAETVETLEDYNAALDDFAKRKGLAVAVDGGLAFQDLIIKNMLGEVRYPDPKIDGERAKMLWGQIKMRTKAGILRSRAAARYSLWVTPHDKSEDPITGKRSVGPDMIGQMARAIIGWFDFAGSLRAEITGVNTVKRTLEFAPRDDVATRQRLPNPILRAIEIPEGGGGWARFMAAVEEALKK